VFLALHGALRARGAAPDAEADLLAAVREVVGPGVPIAATMDLHGNLTAAKVDPLTVLQAYRTNPHRDLAWAGERAGGVLIRALRGQVRPVSAWRSLPMLLGGGDTIDVLRPMRAVFRRMKAIERDPRVLTSSLFMVHPFNDSADLGWSVHVSTDGDPALADALADELAELAWGTRHAQPPVFLSPEEGIAQVRGATLARRLGTCCLVDTSDVVGAGSTGENTHVLRALLEGGHGLLSYVPLRDAVAVGALWSSPAGAAVDLDVGGRLDPAMNPPVRVRGRLGARRADGPFGRALVLDLQHVQLVLTEHAPLPIKPGFYGDLGLSPWRADLVVVKNFFHFRWYYLTVNRKTVAVRTRGCTDLDRALALPKDGPVHPRDVVTDWREADRRRRGLTAGAGTS
jgi:microcystin degradation protein MlrC